METQVLHSRLRITAIVILTIISLNALAAGYSFIIQPSGDGLGISPDYLRQSAPFNDYLIPGIILFSVIGVCGLFITTMAIIRQSKYPVLLILQGFILIGWIGIQLLMVKSFHILHLIIAVAGLALVAIGWILKAHRPLRTHVLAPHDKN